MPKVSVIVPIYKVEEYLDKCICSVLEQSMADFQLILVDDGSPDHCPAICDEFALKDPRIKVIHKENGGLSSARNAAYPHVEGEFVLFLDGDDYLENNALEILCGVQENNNADVVVGNYWYLYEDHEDVAEQQCGDSCMTGYDALKELVSGHIQNFAWSKLICTELVKGHTFPDGKLFEDHFWTHYILAEAERVAIMVTPVVHYRQRSNSISYNFDLKRLDMLDGWIARDEYLKANYPELEKLFLTTISSSFAQLPWLTFTRMKSNKREAYRILKEFGRKMKLENYSSGTTQKLIRAFDKNLYLYITIMLLNKFKR